MSIMLENKKYLFLIEPNKSCQLSFHARWLYSFLVYRTSYDKAASENCICRNVNICNRAVKNYVSELRNAGLLLEINGRYLAREPGEHWQWFAQKSKSESLPWFQRFGSYSVYIPNPHQKLPLMHSALLGLVYSLNNGKKWWHFNTTGLATMMFPAMGAENAKRQVNRAAKNLRTLGLLDEQWNITLQETHHHLWQDADELANRRSRSDVGYPASKEFVLDSLAKYDCRFYGSKIQMGRDLDMHHQAMRKAGYNSKEIAEYWERVMFDAHFCDCHCRLVEMFVKKGFAVAFRVAEEITIENRITGKYMGTSLGLLRAKTQEEILNIKYWDAKQSHPDANGQTSSMLIQYDPTYERLRYATA